MNDQMVEQRIEVGTRVHCILHGGKDGVVFSIEGEQDPGSCKSLGGVVTTGGGARFHVVWDNGTVSRGVPEPIVRGVQWRIFDEVADRSEIRRMLNVAEEAEQARARGAERKAADRAARREQCRAEYPHLKPADGAYAPKAGAANLRKELKHAFPRTRFSVRTSRGTGNAIRVCWTDGPTVEQVEPVTRKYQKGTFNGMEDIYEKDHDNVWPDVFGGADYVFTDREYSDDLVAQVIDELWTELAVNFEKAGIDKPTVEEFRAGKLFDVRDPARHLNYSESVQADIHQRLSRTSA